MKIITTNILFIIFFLSRVFGQIIPTDYSQAGNWAAHPMKGKLDMAFNPSYTIINADTSEKTVVTVPYDTTSNVDIFAIYPTDVPIAGGCLNLPSYPAQNFHISNSCYLSSSDFSLLLNFSPYAKFGRIYAPYYRQANLITFSTPPTTMAVQASIFDTAVTDVLAAFQYYMQNNYKPSKRLILLGYSQGADVLSMVLHKMETDSVTYPYINKIFVAVLAGYEAGPFAAIGKTTGGWLKNYPICQHPLDTGCICTWGLEKYGTKWSSILPGNLLAKNTILKDSNYLYTTLDTTVNYVLNDPQVYSTSFQVVGGAIFPMFYIDSGYYHNITTPCVYYPDMYKALNSEPNRLNYGLLVDTISNPNDNRYNPLDSTTVSDLHVYDMCLTAGDELTLIQEKLNQSTASVAPAILQPISSIRIYPNPSNGQFTLQSSVVSHHPDSYRESVEIYNVLGEKVFSQYSIPNTQYNIDLSAQPSGVYLYRVITEDGALLGSGKMVINK